MDHETGKTIRYAVRAIIVGTVVVLCWGLAGLFVWLIVRQLTDKQHWWEILPEVAVPVLVGPGGVSAWLWWVWRRRIQAAKTNGSRP